MIKKEDDPTYNEEGNPEYPLKSKKLYSFLEHRRAKIIEGIRPFVKLTVTESLNHAILRNQKIKT